MAERDMTKEEKLAVDYLPVSLADTVYTLCDELPDGMAEIRLRCGGELSITSGGENITCGITCTRDEVDYTVGKLCKNSLYSQADSIIGGVITTEYGIRAGVCGRAVLLDGKIVCVRDISSVCIRIPHRVPRAAEPLRDAVRDGKSILVHSPPGLGKTTVLRELALMISAEYKKRCAVIDTRYELSAMIGGGLCDVFLGYPRYDGIMSAVRTMSPEYVVCDEIYERGDVESLRYARASGVAVCASAHAESTDGLLKNESISALIRNEVFDIVCEIERRGKLFVRKVAEIIG